MYAFIMSKAGQTKTKNKQVSIPEGYGPYQTKDEAVGAAINLIRTMGYDDSFYFDDYENNLRLEILNKQTGNRSLVGYIVELS